jgi:hypothetical protein
VASNATIYCGIQIGIRDKFTVPIGGQDGLPRQCLAVRAEYDYDGNIAYYVVHL